MAVTFTQFRVNSLSASSFETRSLWQWWISPSNYKGKNASGQLTVWLV